MDLDTKGVSGTSSAIIDKVYSAFGEAPYIQVLETVQQGFTATLKKGEEIDKMTEAVLKDKLERFIADRGIKCSLTSSTSELADYLYHDMAQFSFISREKLFDIPGFEELNINSWDSVEMIVNGKRQPTDYSFLSPEHALGIHIRMMRITQTVFNDAVPHATADIGPGIRIAALKSPLVDEKVAIVSSIRKVNTAQLPIERLLENGTLTKEMKDFLLLCLSHGVSMAISGETGAGKTSLAGCLLSIVTEKLRTFCIEEGSREWDFVRRDKNGRVLNSVIHTKTRPSDDPQQNIDQEALAKDSLRFDADIIAPGEIRGREAYEITEESNTGHTVITTTHSNSTMDTPGRIVGLAKKAFAMDDSTLFGMVTQAFPILVHIESCADRVRRVTEIREVMGYKNGELQSQMLFEFVVKDNIYEGEDCIKVDGEFRKLSPISEQICKKLLKKGARRSELKPFLKGGGEQDDLD